ncbi:MAG: bifunctional homocysteine S-methyltransferase/methylenetetrahydrofolate reductase [Gemmatimonadota bacterium]
MSPRDARFREMMDDPRPHLFDGGMGTELYSRGVFIHRSFDEANLSRPELVAQIHTEYVKAGAEIILTNTFGANRPVLKGFGFGEQVGEINRRGAALALQAAGEQALVAGSIGPLGIRIEPFGPTSGEEARALFTEQAEALASGGVDLILLETFGALDEILEAIRGVREACDLPLVAQMTVGLDLRTQYGTALELSIPLLEKAGADVVGLNCSVGPQVLLDAVEKLVSLTSCPISIQPNAGLPKEVDGRTLYMASPEYMAEYARRLVLKGAKFVGGCCGTTPAHIAEMANSVRSVSPARPQIRVTTPRPPQAPDISVVPLAERSNWGRKLAAGQLLTSVEIVPPRGIEPSVMLGSVMRLKAAGVDAVNVPDGPRAQLRMGALSTSVLIEQQVGMEAVMHYTCRDRNLLGMLSDLLGAQALGLRNLLLITGDPPKMGTLPNATAVFDIDSVGLTNLVQRLNHGVDLGGNPIGKPTSFVIGVGVNPSAANLKKELDHFFWKVDAGAEYAVTQPIFDTAQLWRFLEELEKRDLRIPIVAGIWPLVSVRNAEFLANEIPEIDVPAATVERMRAASERGKEHAVREGIAIAREVWAEVGSELQGIQVNAPFGRVELALDVISGIPGILAPEAACSDPPSASRPKP